MIEINLAQYDFAIFDCDGVILDSNALKSRAFGEALQGEDQELIDRFIRYHMENGGISRYVKFDHFFRTIKGASDYQVDLEACLQRYAGICRRGLLECEEIPGIRKLLGLFAQHKTPCFVVSGGDQAEVRDAFQTRNLTDRFSGIFGSPTPKKEILNTLRKDGKISGLGIYFGDAQSDLMAAQATGVEFVFVSGVTDWFDGRERCQGLGIPIIEDFSDIADMSLLNRG